MVGEQRYSALINAIIIVAQQPADVKVRPAK